MNWPKLIIGATATAGFSTPLIAMYVSNLSKDNQISLLEEENKKIKDSLAVNERTWKDVNKELRDNTKEREGFVKTISELNLQVNKFKSKQTEINNVINKFSKYNWIPLEDIKSINNR